MGRWEPNARGRLEEAALELYVERGFEQTTVAEIAKLAGLTERTFFRYFTDKREVLFWGSGVVREHLVKAVAEAPEAAAPLDAVAAAFGKVAALMQERRDGVRRRRAIITANPELQERELIKLAAWSAAVAGALRERGVPDPAAGLAAEAGMAAFKIAYEEWAEEPETRDMPKILRTAFDELRAITAAR